MASREPTPRGGGRGGPNSKRGRLSGRGHPLKIRCAVESCKSRMNEPQKLFYPIPNVPAIRNIWLPIIKSHNVVSDAVLTDYICSDHFTSDQKLPNGHLKGNSIPNIFSTTKPVVNCIYCGMAFDNRGKLHSHDSVTHLHESRRWRLECENFSVPKRSLYRADTTDCEECSQRVKVLKQMADIRSEIVQMKTELIQFTEEHCSRPIKLNLPSSLSESSPAGNEQA